MQNFSAETFCMPSHSITPRDYHPAGRGVLLPSLGHPGPDLLLERAVVSHAMFLTATLPRALIAWLSSDRTHRQREPAALVLTAIAGADRGQLGVRQALLPAPRLPSIPATSNRHIPPRSRANSSRKPCKPI